MRKNLVEYMRLNSGQYVNYLVDGQNVYAEYLEQLAKNGTWCGEPEIRALCDLLGVNLRVFSV